MVPINRRHPRVPLHPAANFSRSLDKDNVSASLSQVLRWAYWWNSTEETPDVVTNEQVHFELNTDFSTKGLSAQEIQAIVAAWQANAISRDTMTELFRRGEVLPEGRTNEEVLALVKIEPQLPKPPAANAPAV